MGCNLQRFLVMENRFGQPAILEKGRAEVVVGRGVVRCAGQGVTPERFTIPPISSLPMGAENQSHKNERGKPAQAQTTAAQVSGEAKPNSR